MRYVNAADVLPEALLREISRYVSGELLYIPITESKSSWGEKSGSKGFFQERNQKIKELFQRGTKLEELSGMFGLSVESVRKIVRR